jgi:hypothetical protein
MAADENKTTLSKISSPGGAPALLESSGKICGCTFGGALSRAQQARPTAVEIFDHATS